MAIPFRPRTFLGMSHCDQFIFGVEAVTKILRLSLININQSGICDVPSPNFKSPQKVEASSKNQNIEIIIFIYSGRKENAYFLVLLAN